MKMINEVVNIFEKYVQKYNDKAVIVLKKSLLPCSFKAYKKLTYSLWYTNRETGNGFELVSMDNTARVISEDDEKSLRKDLDEKLILWMFDYIKEKF